MTTINRAEETARVHELRAAFAASDEPDVFRWFAREFPGWQPIETRPQDGAWFLTISPSGAFNISRPIGPGAEEYEVAYGPEYPENDMPIQWMPLRTPGACFTPPMKDAE